MTAIAVFLFFSRFLFDETFFLNSLYVIIIYLVLAFIYSLFVLDMVSIERKYRNRQWRVGDLFNEEVTLINRSFLPVLWLEVSDCSGIRKKPVNHVCGMIKGKGRQIISSSFSLEKRGKIHLGPIEIKSSDPIACFAVKRVLGMSGSITVRPYGINLATGKIHKKDTESARTARFTLQQSDVTSSSVRPYMEGDPLNRIHWPTTARRGRIHSRHQDLSIEQTTWILLDCQRAVHISYPDTLPPEFIQKNNGENTNSTFTLPCDTFEAAVSISLSLADSWMRKGIAVGLALNQDPEFILHPGRGPRQMNEIVDILTFVKPGSPFPVSELLRNLSRRMNPGHICYLVTPDNNRDLAIACHEAESRNIDLRIISIDRMSYGKAGNKMPIKTSRLSSKPFEFSYGDDLYKLSEIL